MSYSKEQIESFNRTCDELDQKSKVIADSIPNGITTSDLWNYLNDVVVVCCGKKMKVDSIRCVDIENGSVWNPVNMMGYQKSQDYKPKSKLKVINNE